jgi:glycerophosphoryl diester phosphodiesterase
MRSSPSKADPLAPGRLGFAHRGLHAGSASPENSFIAFAAALEYGAGIETDLRLTADDRIVLFHDPDAMRMCASPLRIAVSTLQQLSHLRLGGQPIPTLDGLLTLVAGRVPLLLEVKVDNDLWRWMPALARDLSGYDGPFAVMSFDPRILRLLKSRLPRVRRGLLIEAELPPVRRVAYRWVADAQFLAVDVRALGRRWVARARARMPVYAWTVASPASRAQAEVQADALIWEADGRP